MDPTLIDALTRIERGVADNAAAQHNLNAQLGLLAERVEQVITMLTPGERDGSSLDEVLSLIVGQLNGISSYGRETVVALNRMERTLPADVAIAVLHGPGAMEGATGNGRGGRA